MRTRLMAAAVVMVGMCVPGGAAMAQTSDADWLSRCREQGGGQFRHCEVRPVKLAGGGPLHVDARPNGGVQVTGWEQATVEGSARIQVQADTEAEASEIAGRIVIEAAGGTVKADGPRTEGGRSWSVSFVLSAPQHTDLEIEAVNGPVKIAGLTGQIRANTTNGPMSLAELGGDVRVRTTNGPVTIALAGSSWDGEGLDAETKNGPLSLAVPEGYSAQLEVRTVNGPFRLEIPVTMQGTLPGGPVRAIDAPIGAGGARIRAVTANGPVSVEQR